MDGKFTFGINLYQPVLTFLIIWVIEISLITFTLRDMASFDSTYNLVIFVSVIILIFSLVLLILTAGKDPATIPMRVSLNIFYILGIFVQSLQI